MIFYGTQFSNHYFYSTDLRKLLIINNVFLKDVYYTVHIETSLHSDYKIYVFMEKISKHSLYLSHGYNIPYLLLFDNLQNRQYVEARKSILDFMNEYKTGIVGKLYKIQTLEHVNNIYKIKTLRLLEKFYQISSYIFLRSVIDIDKKNKYVNILWENYLRKDPIGYITNKIKEAISTSNTEYNIFLQYLLYYLLVNRLAENKKIPMFILCVKTYVMLEYSYINKNQVKDNFSSYSISLGDRGIIITAHDKEDFLPILNLDNYADFTYSRYKQDLILSNTKQKFTELEYIIIKNLSSKSENKTMHFALKQLLLAIKKPIANENNVFIRDFFMIMFYYALKKNYQIKKVAEYYLINSKHREYEVLAKKENKYVIAILDSIKKFTSSKSIKDAEKYKYIILEVYDSYFILDEHDCNMTFTNVIFSNKISYKENNNAFIENSKTMVFKNNILNMESNTVINMYNLSYNERTKIELIYELSI